MADTLDPRSSFIKAAAQSLGIDPGIIGAHVQLEVGSNSKTAGQFNFGNIKAGKSWAGKVANVDALEYDTRGNAVTEPSTFRSYTSPEEAGADYAALLKRRYPGAVGAKTAGDFASALKTGGYATDPQYVQKFVKVAGGYLPAAPTEGSLVPRPAYQRLADPLQEVMPERMQAGPGEGTGKKPVDLTMQPEVPARPVDRVAEAGAAEKVGLAQAAKENVPFLEMSQRALMTGFEGSLIRLKVARDILGDNPVDPQYKVDPKLLRGLTEAEQDHMLGAVSQRDEDHRKFSILDNRESQEIQSARGQGWAMAAGVVAGLPLGAVTGLGAARAMSLFRAGSAQLMAQGRTGAAIASSLGENVGVEVGLAALQYKIDPFFTAGDAITQMSLGTLLSSAVAAPSLLREGRASGRLTALQDAQSAQRIQDTQAVGARLGPDADPAILTQQVQRLEEERALQTVDAMRSKPPEPMLGEDQRPDFEPPAATQAPAIAPIVAPVPESDSIQHAAPTLRIRGASGSSVEVRAGDGTAFRLPSGAAGEIFEADGNLVATIDGRAVGEFTFGGMGPGINSGDSDVVPEWIGKGVGFALYSHARALAEAAGGTLGPSNFLSDQAAVFWKKFDARAYSARVDREVQGNLEWYRELLQRGGSVPGAFEQGRIVTPEDAGVFQRDVDSQSQSALDGNSVAFSQDTSALSLSKDPAQRAPLLAHVYSAISSMFPPANAGDYDNTPPLPLASGQGRLPYTPAPPEPSKYTYTAEEVDGPRGKTPGFVLTFPNGANTGSIEVAELPGELRIVYASNGDYTRSSVRGSGVMVPAYEELIEEAGRRGVKFSSDDSVTVAAVGVYDALARRGYKLEMNPTAYLEKNPLGERWKTTDGAGVFVVGPKDSDPSLNADRTLSSGYILKEQPMGGGLDEWAVPGNWDTRRAVFSPGGAFAAKIKERTGGFVSSLAELEALPPGVHAVAGTPPHFLQALRAVRQVATKFLGDDFRIVIGSTITDPRVRGAVTNPTENTAIIQLNNSLDEVQAIRTAIHEVGHMIWHKQLSKMPEGTLQAVDTAYQRMMRAWSGQVGGGQVARDRRFSILSPERKVEGGMRPSEYAFSRDEHAAEQFVKYIEDDIRAQGVAVDRAVSSALRAAIDKVIEFIASAGRRLIGVEDEFKAFFDEVKAQVAASRAAPARAEAPAPRPKLGLRRSQSLDSPLDEKESIALDPDMQRLGLTIAPMETPQQRAEAVAVKDLHVKAEKAGIQVDEARLSKLLDTALFQGGQSTANVLLRSKNAVARHFSAMMVENPSGAAGRRPNAAIAKHLHEQAFIGNTINDVQRHYSDFRREAGGNLAEDVFGGKNWEDFNKKIARELEARGRGTAVTSHPAVVKAADSLELAYERMRVVQVNTKTVGSANLPATSKGYMPHRLSNERIRNATNQQLSILHSAMTDQFIMKLDFDPTFSDMLASKYIDRVKNRALGGADSPVGAGHTGSSELVEEALEAAGMTRDQIRATMKKLVTAGPGHTKTRLKLDLNAEHALPDGGTFRLGDLFEDDQFTLLRSQAARVSGEVALTEFGVFGKAGLDVIRRAMQFGEHGAATRAEFDAFDQIAAELLGTPYGTQSKLVDRVLQANAVVRLGGIVWNQGAETINAMWHVGAGRTLDSIIGIPRLLGEVRALARGEAVPNGILEGLEKVYGGAEFGTLSYKTVFPFDNRSMDPHSYGEETITFMDRLLRGASHMQAKLSFWRAVHSAQQRGMAEQIVRKAAVFLKEGRTADIFLKDMGLSDDLIQRMSAELPRIATWDASGRLLELDVTKATDLDAAREFAQVVHRGVSQIIQGTFIGERSKWATDSHMRLLTQFRTFGLTAIEKQYGRQVGNVGEVKALGILLGSMCMSLPIYAARMQVQAMGREDHEEFLERAFQPERVARQSLNYVAGSGLSGDLLDALGALSGADLGGGRTGKEQDFVGNLVLPAAGLFNDAYKGLQNTQEGTDPEKLMKSLPLSNLPYLAPLIRALGED